MIETQRLYLYPMTEAEMHKLLDEETDEEMKQAYGEMIAGCKKHPDQNIWYAIWNMQKKDLNQTSVGDFCFKGLSEKGVVEIGYGIKKEFENQGYMTEAVKEVATWASNQEGVVFVEAEVEEDNIASMRVLEKAGFIANGTIGEEGPRYVFIKEGVV